MTLEDLLQAKDPLTLKALTPSELDEICKPFWPTCRPTFQPKKVETTKVKAVKTLDQQKKAAMELAKQFGLTLKL